MTEFLAQIPAAFGTPLGTTVLAMAGIAFAGLVIAVFWDRIGPKRRDEVSGGSFDIAPPPLLAPRIVSREGEERAVGFALPRLKTLVLGVCAIGLGALGMRGILQMEEAGTGPLMTASFGNGAQSVSAPATEVATERETHLTPPLGYCEEGGSVADRYFEVCANGAAVRFDLLRLSYNDRYLLRPVWTEAAPLFVASESQPAPMALGEGVRFSGPETVATDNYDAFLVIGTDAPSRAEGVLTERLEQALAAKRVRDGKIAELTADERRIIARAYEAEIEETARQRAEERALRLRDFAIASLSGGDRSACASGEMIYTVSGLFENDRVSPVGESEAAVEALERQAARGNEKALADITDAQLALRRHELDVLERPGPVILGITADPMSSDRDGDVKAAIEELLADYGWALQVRAPSAPASLPACARGEAAR